jgi:peptide/nickel transport system substrate-binding protein
MDESPYDAMLDEGQGISRRRLIEGGVAAGALLALPSFLGDRAQAALLQGSAGPKKGGSVTIGMNDGGATETLNPYQLPLFMEALRAQFTYEPLFRRNTKLVPVGALAVSATPGKTAREWKVTLRRGVTFHNGQPFTADDVIYSFKYLLNPKNKAQAASSYSAIDPAGLKKLSTYEVLFKLKQPIGDFKGYLTQGGYIVSKGTTTFTTSNGTGPFKLQKFTAGRRTELVRNDNYWGKVYLDQLNMVPIPDPSQRLNALVTGQIQCAYGIDYTAAKANAKNPKVKLVVSTLNGSFVPFYVQETAPAFQDKRVRQALKLTVDRPAMVRNVLLGLGAVGNDIPGKGGPSYNASLPQHKYDPEKAKSLLKAAGAEDLQFQLYTSTALPGMLESATAWKEQAKSAGVTIDLQKLPADSYFSNDKYLKVPAYQSAWGGQFETWAPQALFKGASYNETNWNRAAWQAAFLKAQGITDDARRNAAYRALQRPVWDESGYIIWGFGSDINAFSPKVRGAVPSPGFNMQPQDWWLA